MRVKRFIQFLIILFLESPINLILHFRNSKLKWSITSRTLDTRIVHQNTSISDSRDNSNFLELCNLAVKNDDLFIKFRSNKDFTQILEHVDYWRGRKYAMKIRNYKSRLNISNFINKYDSIGSPAVYKFRSFTNCSPSLLRYISVYLELEEYFGSLSNLTITEIGVGYGGQAVTISHFEKPFLYNLYDLPEVLDLAEKFISTQETYSKYVYYDGRSPVSIKSDLVISNYAFSELERSLQLKYLNNILLTSYMGYITWNNLSYDSLGGLSIVEILELIPGSEVVPETPTTACGNVLIMWGHKHKYRIE